MASGAKRGGAGDRVLEGRHVIGLFMLVLLFSAIFFTLGYVMGRSQYDVQVSASSNPKIAGDHAINQKPAPEPKRAVVTPAAVPVAPHTGAAAQTDAGQQNSGWELNDTAKPKPVEVHPKFPAVPSSSSASPETKSSAAVKSASNNKPAPVAGATVSSAARPLAAGGGNYNLQVTAVRRESDALDLARRLQKKKFPAYVLAPQGNKFYRVQVGPYADQKSAEAAKKGLENAGFRAIVKRG